jgi:DNA-binding beta-propeller fold protein YncE
VFKFDLKTGKFLKKFLSPTIAGQDFFLSSLALGKDGEVYAADGVNNAVYQVRDDQFRRLFHAPKLTSIRGMTVSADGRLLYLADYERGLIGFDLASGKPFDLPVPKTLALGGIDGLVQWKGDLVVVQNGMEPTRVMRLSLAEGGRSIAGVHPVEANQAAMTVPTLATLAGDTVYVIANSQKNNYDRFGLLIDRNKLEATRIYASQVDYAPPQQPGKMTPVLSN